MKKDWYQHSFRRNLVDMHIDDWDPEFFSQFDAQAYFDCLKEAKIQSPMIYLQSHVGLCNWDTPTGRTHAAFRHNNQVKKLVELCHGAGMDVVGYYSLIYNNWAYDTHPEWRIVKSDGSFSRQESSTGFMSGSRYGLVCPNQEGYRSFVKAQIRELLEEYRPEGIFFDMTFWPMVCCCDACRRRYRAETGREIPTTVNWHDPEWLRFNRARSAWLNEFAAFCTAEVKAFDPDITVEHQFSTLTGHWVYGAEGGINDASDYSGGDLYGGPYQQTFVGKLYRQLSHKQPFEIMTSRCDPNLLDHTTTKSLDALRLHDYLTLAHHGAFLIIDAIDPRGTLNPAVYKTVGKVFEETIPYEPYLTGEPVANTAIYYSMKSKMDVRSEGMPSCEADLANPHRDSSVGASIALSEHDILFTVLTEDGIDKIFGCAAVILSGCAFLSQSERETFLRYVQQGGCVYLSGDTDPELVRMLLGLEVGPLTKEKITYLSPTGAGAQVFAPLYEARYPLACKYAQPVAEMRGSGTVLATLTLPYTDPADLTRFAAIHSNPPGRFTDSPAVVEGSCGSGRVLWSAAAIEGHPQKAHRDVFVQLLQHLVPELALLHTDAPSDVQFTLFDDWDAGCLYLNCLNLEEKLARIDVGPISIRLKTGRPVHRVRLLPDGPCLPFTMEDGCLRFTLPHLELFAMLQLETGSADAAE